MIIETEAKKNKLFKIVCDFQKEHDISCEESVYQDDDVILNACDFINDLMKAIGAYNEK